MTQLLVSTANPVARALLLFATTLFGAAAMYMFSLHKGFEGATPFLKRIIPTKSEVFYSRVDFLIVVVAGSVIGTIFFQPTSPLQALSAGFGWVGAINVLIKQGTQAS